MDNQIVPVEIACMNGVPAQALCFTSLDNDQWLCVFGDFKNSKESPYGIGNSYNESITALRQRFEEMQSEKAKPQEYRYLRLDEKFQEGDEAIERGEQSWFPIVDSLNSCLHEYPNLGAARRKLT